MIESFKKLFDDFEETLFYCREIESLEEEIDKIEWNLKKDLFEKNNKEELAMKMLKKDFINHLADISDRIEDASDILEIIVMKRRI